MNEKVTPYTDAEIDSLRKSEHSEILPNCPTCKWLVTVDRLQAQIRTMRNALTRIAEMPGSWQQWLLVRHAKNIAEEALEETDN